MEVGLGVWRGEGLWYKKLLLAPRSGRSYFSIRERKKHPELMHCKATTAAPAGWVHHKLNLFKTQESSLVLKK